MRIGKSTPVDITVGLDLCAETDLVDLDFALQQKFDQAKLTPPQLRAAGKLGLEPAGVYKVITTATDARGTTWQFVRDCVAIRNLDYAVLFGAPTIEAKDIFLGGTHRQWWFNIQWKKHPVEGIHRRKSEEGVHSTLAITGGMSDILCAKTKQKATTMYRLPAT
ncbi:hypothetical protein VUR80DRAFT_8183 [Thermomyces stellatus]